MSEWIEYCKKYATQHNVTYRQAMKEAGDSYKTRNDVKSAESKKKKKEHIEVKV